ncbi:hypothetical protein GYA49_03940 [Candidatus Beckwithbacteria bacterium]|nr:hypothetical protein [Candidatus Beckwithbacteria bacterium]
MSGKEGASPKPDIWVKEQILTPEERAQVLAFEADLTRGELPFQLETETGKVEAKAKGLEKIWQPQVRTIEFYLDYFLDDKGWEALQTILTFPDETERPQDLSTLSSFLYSYCLDPRVDETKLKELAEASREFAKTTLAEQLSRLNSEDPNLSQIKDPTRIKIILNPELFLAKMQDYLVLDTYHQIQVEALVDNTDSVSKASLAVLETHRTRLRDIIGQNYATVLWLIRQTTSNPSDSTNQQRLVQLKEFMKVISVSEEIEEVAEVSDELVENYVLNDDRDLKTWTKQLIGAIAQREKAQITAIDIAQVEKDYAAQQAQISVTQEQRDKFNELFPEGVEASALVTMISSLLKEQGITVYFDQFEQVVPSESGWSIKIVERRNSILVSSRKREILIPSETSRSLIQTIRGLLFVNSEVIQIENRARLSKENDAGSLQLLAEVGMAKSVGINDIMPDYWRGKALELERWAAAQRRLEGASLAECVWAAYKELKDRKPDTNNLVLLRQAFVRVEALFDNAGWLADRSPLLTSASPLSHISGVALHEDIKDQKMEELLLIGGINVEQLMQLHHLGVIDLQNREDLIRIAESPVGETLKTI